MKGNNEMKTAAFFDKFSREYELQDRYRYLFYRWIIKNIIKQIDKEDCDILDVGMGTGNLAVRLAMKYPRSRILGVDVSNGMINKAKTRCRSMGITNIRFRVGSIEELRTGKFDFVVSALAFHHIENKKRVISNLYAKLAQGGKLVIGDWFEPDERYEKEISKLRAERPRIASKFDKSWQKALEGMTKNYGEEHPKEYPVSQTEMTSILKGAGFSRQEILKSLLPNFANVIGAKD